MRVIQTTQYFDDFEIRPVRRKSKSDPGVTFAWFKGDFRDIDFTELVKGEEIGSEEVQTFFDLALANREAQFGQKRSGPLGNERAIILLMDTKVVVESSPPEAIPFSTLLRNASAPWIGAYIGWRLAGDNPMLMLLTVPAGMLVISSAMGVAKALEAGLNKKVLRLLTTRTRRR